tara:strand:+ start:1952 stop:6370 length:4419 start_codon:yes stop_codon:yes gene_type:complete
MSCSSKISTKDYLVSKGVIDKNDNIKDSYNFDISNKLLTALAQTKYGLVIPKDGRLLGREGNKVSYKDELFNILDVETETFEASLIDQVLKYLESLAPKETVMTNTETNIFGEEINEFVEDFSKGVEVTRTPAEYLLFGETTPAETKTRTPLTTQAHKKGSVAFSKAQKLDEALYNQGKVTEIPATEILNNIINHYSSFSTEGNFFVEQAQSLLAKTNTNVVLIPKATMTDISGSPHTFMAYNSKYNRIYLSLEVLNTQTLEESVIAILHEVVHSVTVQAYKQPSTIEEEMFRDFIQAEYQRYTQYYKEDNPGKINRPYGLVSAEEFMAEIIANPDFRNQMDKLKDNNPTKKSFIVKLVEAIRRLFGLQKTEANKNIVEEILKISKPFDYTLDSESALFEKRVKEYLEEDLLIDDSTLEKRILNTITKLSISLDSSIKSLSRQLDFATEDETSKTQFLEEQIQLLQTVKQDLEALEISNKILAVESFTKIMIGNMEAIKTALGRVDLSDEEYVLNAVKRYDKIVSAYSIIDDVQDIIAAIETDAAQDIISKKDLESLKTQAEMASGRFHGTKKNVEELTKKYMIQKLNHVKYFKEVETIHYNRLAKEYRESKIIGDKEQWIIKTMATRDKARIDEDVEVAVTKLINNKAWDIFAADVTMSSGINVSAPLIQIMHQILTEIDEVRNKDRAKKDLEFEKLFAALKEEKGTNDIKKLYENILDVDNNGKAHIKGEYNSNFISDVYDKIKSIRREYDEKIQDISIELNELPINTDAWNSKRAEYQQLVLDKKAKIEAIETQHTVKLDNNTRVIKDSWKNDLSGLTKTENEVREFFIDLQEDIRKMTYPTEAENNIKYAYKGKFYELPKITKSDTERFFQGDIKGIIADKVKEAKGFRPDDFGYVERVTDLSGRKMRALKLWYRDPSSSFVNADQSLDLMGIMRMDYINASAHQTRGQFEQEVNFLLDIAESKDYYNKEGTIPVVSKLFKKYDIISGENSNTVKMLNNMVEAKFYDILNKGSVRIGSVDANKAVTFINSASAFLTLSLNLASGTANVVNANAQLFIESFLKGRFITAAGIKKANSVYAATLGDSMSDLTRPFSRSFPNQLQEYFNTKGLFDLAHADFLRTDLIKVGLNAESLRVFQESGEHYIQSVISMAVLDGIKVMDVNHNFINKEGKIVKTKKESASLLDMMEVDKVDGLIKLNSNVVYTTHSKLVKWSEGGKENVDTLIAKKLYDTIGNYRPSDQPDITRSWYGKLMMLYRKFLIPMGQARLRGLESSFTKKDDLKDHEKRYSYALQEYEEGYYTTFIRYVMTSIKDKKMYLTSKEKVWDNLSDYEKHNIKKFVTEGVMTSVLLPLTVQLIASLQGGDDNEYVFFLLYQIRRLETELSQYKSPSESFKMMRSPIPSMRLLETSLSIFSDTFQPWKWGDEYQNGHNKNKNKYMTKLYKQIPVAKDFQRTYKDLFEYQNSYFGFK